MTGTRGAERAGAQSGVGRRAARERLLVADSFRVRVDPATGEAQVRGWERHRDRFTRGVIAASPGAAERTAERERRQSAATEALRAENPAAGSASFLMLPPAEADQRIIARVDAFLADALPRIADFGDGFPRLELWGEPEQGPDAPDPELRLSLRPLPELRDTIELRTAGRIRLDHPERKGPNIDRFSALNRELGAEALLLDRGGRVLEGTTTSLVWWTDGSDQSGHCVETPRRSTAERVESVTEGLLREAAQNRLVGSKPHRRRTGSFSEGRPTPAELVGCEVWAVNALHGIRPVTRIDGIPMPAPDAKRLGWFREALDRTWRPLLEK